MYESAGAWGVTRPWRPLIAVLGVWIALWAGPTLGAQPEGAEPAARDRGAVFLVEPPDSRAGRQLRWAVEMFSSDRPVTADEARARFTEAFLQQVPPAMFAQVAVQVRGQMFKNGRVELRGYAREPEEDRLVAIVGARGGDPARLYIETEPEGGLMNGLLIQPAPDLALPPTNTWEEFDALLEKTPGRVGFSAIELVPNDADPTVGQSVPGLALRGVHGFGHHERLAIGSTFKLYVLATLLERIRSGEASWDDTLAIRDELKSLPSGVMQGLGAGEERTLLEFATKMISISDNTATDHLIEFLGRERIEEVMARTNGAPERNRPFLKTKEMFQIKLVGDDSLIGKWAAASEAEKRAMLAPGGLVASREPSLALAALWTAPRGIEEAEWFASPFECCRAIAEIRSIELSLPEGAVRDGLSQVLRSNPGMGFDGEVWKSVGFKGGSEPGVLSLTWLLERADGRWFCMSLGINDTQANPDLNATLGLATRAAGLLAGAP